MQCQTCHKQFKLESKFIHHTQKCKPIQCNECKTFFKTTNSLKRHLNNRKDILHNGTKFCNNAHLQRHLRTIKKPMEKIPDLNQQILERTGYENKKGFKDTVKQHINEIKDSHKTTKLYEVINKQITSSYTYKDLHELLLDIYTKHKCPYKINLGMGYILYNIIEKQYKYHYVSTNNLLFDYAQTIANKKDINKLMKRIISLDLTTTYYFKRPNSNFTMGGLINVEIRIFNLNGTIG